MARRTNGTATSAFGVGRRESHDASSFYARFRAPVISNDETVGHTEHVDVIHVADARTMPEVGSASVALVVTSPPYFAGKAYETDLGSNGVPATYLDYLQLLTDVFAECARTLEPGGRIAVNVANLGRRPYRSLSGDVATILQDRLGLLLRGEVVWRKGRGAGGNCAWGSYRSPANPTLRDVTERVVIASKGRFDRALGRDERAARGLPHEPTIAADEFLEATLDVWELAPESATRVGHPAPFPVELPQRLIELYTYRDDLVLDPFMGSGSTAVAAVTTGRHYVGYETDASYARSAQARADAVATPAAGPAPDQASKVARAWLVSRGHTIEKAPARLPGGLEVAFETTGPEGRPVLVDVAGGFTTGQLGLARAELVWRSIARAVAARHHRPDASVLVLTPQLPAKGTPPASALRAAIADGLLVVEALPAS